MLLCVDVGNTNITLGVYQNENLIYHWRLSTDHERMPDEYGLQLMGLFQRGNVESGNLEGVVLSSVVPPLTGKWIDISRNYLSIDPLVITNSTNTGIRILYEDPAAVGADRIVNSAAAFYLYGGPACIVDFGTATTFDALTEKAEYLGGAIVPGIGISADALFHRTAKLPRVDLHFPPSVIGSNTTHAIQSGLLYGYSCLVDGMVELFRKELGTNMRVIATGGLADIFAPRSRSIQVSAPWLTLDGLRMIYNRNKE